MKPLREQIQAYIPQNEEEVYAKERIFEEWDYMGDKVFQRPVYGHFTASAMVLDYSGQYMLMVYHNIYDSLSWTGGHADGEQDLMKKAMEEAKEETGILFLEPITADIISIDVLPVKSHKKKDKKVEAHQHFNITYGFVASDQQPLRIKPDENTYVCWVRLDDWQSQMKEPHMIPVYEKVLARMLTIMEQKTACYHALPDLLLPWYAQNARKLPWREDKDPYHIWVSEVMLQQTRVEAVKGYYQRFLEQLPDIASLAAVSEEELMKLWEGLGYYTRARNLKKAAQVIMDEYDGMFPSEYRAILSLPGIGEYTAAAIGSICFDLPEPAIDGNVMRIISRITENYGNIQELAFRRRVAERLRKAYPTGPLAYAFNQSMMELGAMICIPNGEPKCDCCPVQSICMSYKNGAWTELPHKGPKKERKKEFKTIFVMRYKGKIAIRRREDTGLLSGMWEYPNVSGNISVQSALNQAEKWRVKPLQIEKELQDKHIFTHIEWHMRCYYIECDCESGEFTWVTEDELKNTIALPTAFKRFSPEHLQ